MNKMALDFAAIAIVAATFIVALYFYGRLPDIIPIHFNMVGTADRFGSKSLLFLCPILSVLLYLLLRFIGAHRISTAQENESIGLTFAILKLEIAIVFFLVLILVILSAYHID